MAIRMQSGLMFPDFKINKTGRILRLRNCPCVAEGRVRGEKRPASICLQGHPPNLRGECADGVAAGRT
jgi:hypothetical protein